MVNVGCGLDSMAKGWSAAIEKLRFSTTVARQLVHKAAVEEVLLTDVVQLDRNQFMCAGQLPRTHSFFNDTIIAHHDLLLLVEFVRQAAIYVSHKFLDVPLDAQFIFRSLDVRRTVDVAGGTADAVSHLVIDFTIARWYYKDGALTGYQVNFEFFIDGRGYAVGHGSQLFMSQSAFAQLREQSTQPVAMVGVSTSSPVKAEPSSVGRLHWRNTVISYPCPSDEHGELATNVIVDLQHPFFFDHPLDHVPAMLLLEAFRQTAIAAAGHWLTPKDAAMGLLLRACRVKFMRYAELHLPLYCMAKRVKESRSAASDCLTVAVDAALIQAERRIAHARIVVTAP
jgi:hypothetical protein